MESVPSPAAVVSNTLPEQLQHALGSDYTVERELSGGGMSRVFVAEEMQLGRRVVVKVLAPELTEGMSAERFAREVRLAARLQHPNIVPLLAAGERGGLAYYTMPLVEGESLRAHLARVGRMPVDAAVSVLRDVARALEYAHAHGVVHRDVKPGNILLAGSAAAVTDFGIAKALHAARTVDAPEPATETLTRAGTSVGTPAYMAPEQAAGDPDVDSRADVYAWGVVAYELLAGAPPFVGPSAHHLVAAQIGEAPRPLGDLAAGLPPALSALVMRCLEKAPSKRPHSGGELLAALEATRTLSGERPLVWTRGPRRQVIVGAGVLVMLLGAAVIALMMNHLDTSAAAARPVLAVLPFENVGAANDADFAEGLTEEVRARLTKISGLQVIGGRSSAQYKGSTKSPGAIARELGATHLLSGKVRWEPGSDGGRVRVSPDLVRADDQTSVWAEPVEGPMGDVFALQAQVAERVADALNVALVGGERRAAAAPLTTNVAAYDAYLRGIGYAADVNFISIQARRDATLALERAVTLDPRFAQAHARLALVYLEEVAFAGSGTGVLAKARASVTRALALDSTLVASQFAHARLLSAEGKREGAYRALQAAARVAPNDPAVLYWMGRALVDLERHEEAVESFRRAAELEPRWAGPVGQLAGTYDQLSRHEEAIRTREREIALEPRGVWSYVAQAESYMLWRGDTAAARHTLARGDPAAIIELLTRVPLLSAGRAIWLSLVPPAVLVAKDTLTLAGFQTDHWGTGAARDVFHLVKARHFAVTGRPALARAHADSIIALLEPALRRGPGSSFFFGLYSQAATLAEAYAYVGRWSDAARTIDRNVDDARQGRGAPEALRPPTTLVTAAYVDVLIGRKDLAVARLEEALRLPSGMWISRALLRADPWWAPLRGHPGFERLIAGGGTA